MPEFKRLFVEIMQKAKPCRAHAFSFIKSYTCFITVLTYTCWQLAAALCAGFAAKTTVSRQMEYITN